MVMLVAGNSLWLTKDWQRCAKKQHYQTKVTELVTKRIVSQIEAQHCRLESLYPVFKDASIKRFVPQLGNKTAQTLCALCTASFWLEVKDPSQSQKILVGTQQRLIKATRF